MGVIIPVERLPGGETFNMHDAGIYDCENIT